MIKPSIGSKVRVEFDGTVVDFETLMRDTDLVHGSINPKRGFFGMMDEIGITYVLWDDFEGAGEGNNVFTVTEKPEPEGWPVQVGDIWEANGEEYFVHSSINLSDSVYVKAASGRVHGGYRDYRLENFKMLNPILIRRRGSA